MYLAQAKEWLNWQYSVYQLTGAPTLNLSRDLNTWLNKYLDIRFWWFRICNTMAVKWPEVLSGQLFLDYQRLHQQVEKITQFTQMTEWCLYPGSHMFVVLYSFQVPSIMNIVTAPKILTLGRKVCHVHQRNLRWQRTSVHFLVLIFSGCLMKSQEGLAKEREQLFITLSLVITSIAAPWGSTQTSRYSLMKFCYHWQERYTFIVHLFTAVPVSLYLIARGSQIHTVGPASYNLGFCNPRRTSANSDVKEECDFS